MCFQKNYDGACLFVKKTRAYPPPMPTIKIGATRKNVSGRHRQDVCATKGMAG